LPLGDPGFAEPAGEWAPASTPAAGHAFPQRRWLIGAAPRQC